MLFRTALVILLALAHPAAAQINSGIITGSITDPQKAAVPNAKIEAVEDSTQFSYSTISNNSGEYTLPYLKAGVYTVTVTAKGFPVYRVSGVTVQTGNTVRTDVPLQLSQVATQVEVSASADQLQSDSTTKEGAVGRNVIDAVPNANQNPLYYASLLEGVVGRTELSDTTAFQSFGIGYDGRRWQSALNVDGASAFSASIQLDGLSVTSGAWNESAVLPNVDSLQEVRVVTSNFTAEFGRGMGAIKMATKSGTNQWHGSARDSFRNEVFNANTFKSNANSIARAPFRVNDFGFTIGGPILKDKLFIFASYDILRHKDSPQWLWTVPTALQRAGDFSQTVVSGTNGVPTAVGIFDPDNVIQTSATVYTRAPFPGAIIPTSQISPFALKIMNIYPLPNRAPTDAFGANNFFAQRTRPFQRSNNNNRLDYRHSRHSIYASGGVSIGSIDTPSPFPDPQWFGQPTTNSGGTPARHISDDNPYVQLGDTVVLSPTVVLDIRGGVNRIHSNSLNYPPHSFTASDYDALGIPRSVQAVMPQFGAAPDIASPGYYSNAAWAQYSGKQERQTNSSITGSVTKMRGKWTHKFGGEFRVYQGNYTDYQFNAADYQASTGSYTVQNITAAGASTNNNAISQQGFSGANLLVGGGGWLVPPNPSSRPALTSKYIGIFSQNDWRATSRLTLNLGVRYEIQPGPTDRFNRSTSMDLSQPSPFAAAGSPLSQPYMGIIVFPGNNGLDRNLWNTTWTNWGPRVGAAYKIGQNWVVRGGYGVAYGANNTGWYDGPFAYNQGAFTPGTQILPYGTNPNGSLAGHFWDAATSPLILPPGADSKAAQLYGNGGAYFNVNSERPGRVQMWNIFIERQISRSWFVSAGYNGSRGAHLFQSRYPLQNNQLIPSAVLASWKQTYISTNAGTNPANTQVQNPLQPVTGALLPFVGALAQRTLPQADLFYPRLALLSDTIQYDNGQSDYNALKVRVRHSGHGFFFDANYTWSKATDSGYTELQDAQGFSDNVGSGGGGSNGVLDILNDRNNKKLSYSDVPHRVVATLTYEFPFGKGGRFAMSNSAARAALGGWRLGSVFTWQKGFPLSPTGLNGGSLNGRADRNTAPNEPLELPKNLQGWYDGKKSITLPDGRTYTPCSQCYLEFNPDAFVGETLTTANGGRQANLFWWGNGAIDYAGLRGPGRSNFDFSLTREFRIKERYSLSFLANLTNALNHTQFRPGSFTMGLGSIQVTDIPAQGVLAGESQNASTYGSHNMNTFDPRQMILELRLRF
jgi:Carboxypeptidase regulatory-like domain/TonB dependent receptor-like, beta-barrel